MPIFKNGDRTDHKNYRGISILNTCSKMYCKILNINCRPTQKSLRQKHKIDSERDFRAHSQHFASNY